MKKVKITVLKKKFFEDIADAYLTERRTVGPCPLLEEGNTFIFEGMAEMPKGFCPWVWIDIFMEELVQLQQAQPTPRGIIKMD